MVLVLHATFIQARIDEFFDAADQLNLVLRTREKMADEGIATIVDLPEFDDKDVKALVEIFAHPPRALNALGNLVNQVPYAFPAKSQKRLKIAVAISKYYDETSREVTPEMMMWPTLKSFATQMDALEDTVAPPDITPMKASMQMTKFLEYFDLHCNMVIGKRGCPVKYVFREHETPPAVGPVFLPNQPHSEEHGSVEAEMVARFGFDHPLYRNDSSQVYTLLSQALQGTKYHATIARFKNVNGRQDGHAAYMALKSQHAGQAVWEAQIKSSDDFMKGRKWNGQTTISLENHFDGHRNAYVNLTEASHHVAFQLPNERTRVTQFLDSLSCPDPELLAAIAAVKKDDPGMRDSFEQMATFITPSDPVARKQRTHKRPAAEISSAFTVGAHNKHGNSGVELRWYKQREYLALTDDQRDELKGWAATQPDNRKNKAVAKKATKSKKATASSTTGVVTVGSIKYKKLMRAKIKAMQGNAGHYGPNKKDKESDALISAIKALATATAKTASADVGSTKAVTFTAPTHAKTDEMKVAEAAAIQIKAILKNGKPGN